MWWTELVKFIFLVAYHFLFAVYSNLPSVTFIFYLYSFFFHSPRWRFVVLQTEISGKYNSPLYFSFLCIFFSITLPTVRINLLFYAPWSTDVPVLLLNRPKDLVTIYATVAWDDMAPVTGTGHTQGVFRSSLLNPVGTECDSLRFEYL